MPAAFSERRVVAGSAGTAPPAGSAAGPAVLPALKRSERPQPPLKEPGLPPGDDAEGRRVELLSNLSVKLTVGTDLLIFKCLLSICCKVLYIL